MRLFPENARPRRACQPALAPFEPVGQRIRNGVDAIDSVTTAPNSDAASGLINCADVVAAKSTKPNLPAWLSRRGPERPAVSEHPGQQADERSLGDYDRQRDADDNNGRSAISCRPEADPTERKNRPRRIERKGSTSLSSSWRYGSGKHDARHEGPQGDGQVQRMVSAAARGPGIAPRRRTASLAEPTDEAKERIEDDAADDHQGHHRDYCAERQLPSRRRRRVRRATRAIAAMIVIIGTIARS